MSVDSGESNGNELLRAEEVAKILGLKVSTLAVWRCEKRFPLQYCKIGGAVRYRRKDVDNFIESRLREGDK